MSSQNFTHINGNDSDGIHSAIAPTQSDDSDDTGTRSVNRLLAAAAEQIEDRRHWLRSLTVNLRSVETRQENLAKRVSQLEDDLAEERHQRRAFEQSLRHIGTEQCEKEPPETDGGIQCVSPTSGSENDRDLEELSAGTNMATLLREIAESNGYVSANTLREESTVAPGSVGPALSNLWKRRHVERQRTESPDREYEYQLSDYGRGELKRLEGEE